MKIVHLDQMFHPEFGDQINILSKFQALEGHEVIIVTASAEIAHPRFAKFADNADITEKDATFMRETSVNVIRLPIFGYYSGRAIFKSGYKKFIDELKPDILFCHYNDSLLGMHYTYLSKKLDYPVIFDSHMLRMASVNKFNKLFQIIYKNTFAKIINKRELKVIRTQDEDYINTDLGIEKELTPFISFGSDTKLFYPDLNKKLKMKEIHNLKDDFIILYAGQINKSKGVLDFVKALNVVNSSRKYVFMLIGKGSEEYLKDINREIDETKYKYIKLNTQKYKELANYYNMADLVVFPKQSSLSFYDVQACGTPVLLENNNINVDRVKHNNGFLYKKNNLNDLVNSLETIMMINNEEYAEIEYSSYKLIQNNYNYINITREYTDLMNNEVKKYNENR